MGAFVREAHFVRNPALAPAPAAVPETKPHHTPLRTAHDPLRLASPAASCLAALRHPPLCPHRTPLCASLPLPQDNKYGDTPLIRAIIEENTALVPVLLKATVRKRPGHLLLFLRIAADGIQGIQQHEAAHAGC